MNKLTNLIFRYQNRPKIFCIGFNKTGTTSLHQFFLSAGLRSTHNHYWPIASHMPSGKEYFNNYQCFSDGEKSSFVNLQRWFPNAQFILNTREERAWVLSRVKHVMRRNFIPPKSGLMQSPDFHLMAKEFFFDPEAAIGKWILERRIYEDQSRTYFANQSCFLEIDLTKDKEWTQKLNNHLLAEGVAHTSVEQEIFANKRDQVELFDQSLFAEYTAIVDRWLQRIQKW